MKTTSPTPRRQSRAQQVLSDPRIQSYLAKNRELEAMKLDGERIKDVEALRKLTARLDGRQAKPLRTPFIRSIYSGKITRDPRAVAWRWLKRVRGGTWYRGGSHVARLNYGPGIAFEWRNDSPRPIKAGLINAGGVA